MKFCTSVALYHNYDSEPRLPFAVRYDFARPLHLIIRYNSVYKLHLAIRYDYARKLHLVKGMIMRVNCIW